VIGGAVGAVVGALAARDGHRRAYHAPAPVYVAPPIYAPRPRYYRAPRRVYYAPPPPPRNHWNRRSGRGGRP
jgi:hypothetical protein